MGWCNAGEVVPQKIGLYEVTRDPLSMQSILAMFNGYAWDLLEAISESLENDDQLLTELFWKELKNE